MTRLARTLLALGLLSISMETGLFAFVSVDPGAIEIFEVPGKKASGYFAVKNPLKTEVEVEMKAQPFQEAAGMVKIPHDTWLHLPKTDKFNLEPGQTRKVKYKVRVPRELAGETMAIVYFIIHVAEPTLGGATVERRHGIPVYVAAKNSEKVQAEIQQRTARFTSQVSSMPSPIEFSVSVKNNGNVHLRPKGRVQIFKDDRMVEQSELQSGWPVFPGTQHTYFAATAKSDWEAGQYRAKFFVEYGDLYHVPSVQESSLEFKVGPGRKLDVSF